jgi:hypothetical protein
VSEEGGGNVAPFPGEEGLLGQRQRLWEVAAAAPGRTHLSVKGRWLGRKGGGREVGHG